MERPFIPLRDTCEQRQRVDAYKCLQVLILQIVFVLKIAFYKKLVPLLFLKFCKDCYKALEGFQEEN